MHSKGLEKKYSSQIAAIREELNHIGSFIRGSLTEQYNVCGTSGCRCKDPKNPKKHGPYYQLAYYKGRKHTTTFIPNYLVSDIKKRILNYKKFKAAIEKWSKLEIESALNKIRAEKNDRKKKSLVQA